LGALVSIMSVNMPRGSAPYKGASASRTPSPWSALSFMARTEHDERYSLVNSRAPSRVVCGDILVMGCSSAPRSSRQKASTISERWPLKYNSRPCARILCRPPYAPQSNCARRKDHTLTISIRSSAVVQDGIGDMVLRSDSAAPNDESSEAGRRVPRRTDRDFVLSTSICRSN
jgi:hypothetical protein